MPPADTSTVAPFPIFAPVGSDHSKEPFVEPELFNVTTELLQSNNPFVFAVAVGTVVF